MKIMYLSSTHAGMHTHSIYYDLMCELRDRGHDITVVYAREKRLNKPTELYEYNGLQYLGIRTGNMSKNKNLIEKGISTLSIDFLMKRAVKEHLKGEKFDAILYSTPPITLLKTLGYVKKNMGARSYLMLKDIFPQNAVDLGMFKKNGPIYSFFRSKEKKLYAMFDRIGVMSPANRDFLLSNNNIDPKLIEVFPNTLKPLEVIEKKASKESFGIQENKVTFLYGGNLGKPQNIPFVVECLKSIEHLENVHIIIAGSGGDEHLLNEYVAKYKPNNFSFYGFLSPEEYQNVLSISDVGLIFLDYRFTIPNFPQRLLGYMEAAIPVLSCTDESTDIGDIIEENQFGIKTFSNEVESWYNGVVKLAENDQMRVSMGHTARQYFLDNYTVQKSCELIEKFMEEKIDV